MKATEHFPISESVELVGTGSGVVDFPNAAVIRAQMYLDLDCTSLVGTQYIHTKQFIHAISRYHSMHTHYHWLDRLVFTATTARVFFCSPARCPDR